MKTIYFGLLREYEISCKAFLPESNDVKRVIVGVHGFAGDKESSMLEKLAELCVPDGAALICFDFPAHGKSSACEEKLTVANCEADLLFVAEYVREKYPAAPKSIFATSFGGYITLLSAGKLEDFSFVLRAPAVSMPRLLLKTVLKIDLQTFREKKTVTCGFERPIELPFSFYEELQTREDLLGENRPGCALDRDFEFCSKPFAQSILIIHGDADDVVPLSHIKRFAGLHPEIKIVLMEGADHRFKKEGQIELAAEYAKDFWRKE